MEISLKDNDLIVSKTDTKGKITYGNEAFIRFSGYAEEELLNQPHNILRHQEMPKIIFKLLWERIQNRQVINAYVKNRTKQNDYYWVFASVTTSVDKNNTIIGYHSARRKPSSRSINTISQLYKNLLEIEKRSGLQASEVFLNELLKKEGVSYDEYVINLQK